MFTTLPKLEVDNISGQFLGVVFLMKDNEHISKAEAAGLAARQHVPVREFLNQESIRKDLLLGLGESNELTLLKELLKKKRPVTSRYMKDMYDMGGEVTSRAARHVKRYLENFSERFSALNAKNVVMSIYRKVGGNQVGYYFACLNTQTDEYLDGTETKNLLGNLWQYEIDIELRKKLKEEAKAFLSEKLHDRDDYLSLEMEIGDFERKQRMSRSESDLFNGPQDQDPQRTWKPFNPDSLLDLTGRYILVSEAGTGKTTFLRHLQKEVLGKSKRLPIFLHAAEIEGWTYKGVKTFLKNLVSSLELDSEDELMVDFLERKTKDRMLLLIDGLDQIRGVGTEYTRFLRSLFCVCETGCIDILISSRPTAIASVEDDHSVSLLRLKLFGEDTQKAFFGKQYDRAYELCRQDHDMMGVPMLAYMIRTLIEEGKNSRIRNRACLYEEFIDFVLYGRESLEMAFSINEREVAREFLQKVAFEALAKEEPYVERIPLSFCRPFLPYKGLTIDRLLKLGLVSLVTDRSKGMDRFLCFTHQSFQEYLAAQALAEREDCIETALKYVYYPVWNQILVMLGGVIHKPSPYIAALLRENKNDFLCRPFMLAVKAADAGRDQLPAGLFDSLARITGETCLRSKLLWTLMGGAPRLIDSLPELAPYLVQVRADNDILVGYSAEAPFKRVGSERCVLHLEPLCRDDNYSIRIRVADALGNIGSEHCARLLLEMANDDNPRVRTWIAEALGRTGSDKVIDPLLTMLNDESDDVRQHAAAALGDICAEEAVEPLLTTLREDPVGKVQVEAALAIGQIGSARALEPMLQVAKKYDYDSWMIAEALGALGSAIGTEEATKMLLQTLEETKRQSQSSYSDRYTLAPIIRSLGKIGSHHATLPLLEILQEHEDKEIRGTAAIALGRIGAEEAIDTLAASIHEYDAVLSHDALGALARICPQRAATEFLKAMHRWPTVSYPDDWLELVGIDRAKQMLEGEMASDMPNYAAVRALGDIGSEYALETLLKILRNESYDYVREEAIEALAAIGCERAVEPLTRALRDEYYSEEAAAALGKIGSEQAMESLLHVLDSGETDIMLRESIISALGEIGSARAMKSIVRVLRDEKSSIRKCAVEALGRLGCGDSIGPMISGLDDGVLCEWEVRAAVAQISVKTSTSWKGDLPTHLQNELVSLSDMFEDLAQLCESF